MKITLAEHVIAEVVGDQLFLLDSQEKQVYSIPMTGVSNYAPEARTLEMLPPLHTQGRDLIDSGLATLPVTLPGTLSRRAVVGSGVMLAAGSIAAMSFPAVVMASSTGSSQLTGLWTWAGFSRDGGDLQRVTIEFSLDDLDKVIAALGVPLDEDSTLTVFGISGNYFPPYEEEGYEPEDGTDFRINFNFDDDGAAPGFTFFADIVGTCPLIGQAGDYPVQAVISSGQKSVQVVFRWDGQDRDDFCVIPDSA